jgi:hypothetical protein
MPAKQKNTDNGLKTSPLLQAYPTNLLTSSPWNSFLRENGYVKLTEKLKLKIIKIAKTSGDNLPPMNLFLTFGKSGILSTGDISSSHILFHLRRKKIINWKSTESFLYGLTIIRLSALPTVILKNMSGGEAIGRKIIYFLPKTAI